MANTITGTASLFRSNLLAYILPFPKRILDAYHDHWIACVALTVGTVKYVDRPLLDYTQHSSQVVGWYSPPERPFAQKLAMLRRTVANTFHLIWNKRLSSTLAYARLFYCARVSRVELLARTLELRCARVLVSDKERTLRRLASIESATGIVWLALRGLNIEPHAETLGEEHALLVGILWKHLTNLRQ